MRTIVHSIHSQVPQTIRELGHDVRVVISLDSHLDVSLGEDDDVYPPRLLTIARRTSAHTDIRKVVAANSSRARVIVAIPESMLLRHAQDIEANLPANLRMHDDTESVASVRKFLASRGIETLPSPPGDLFELAKTVGLAGRWVLDIDVDCIGEMQRECYTSIINPTPGTLQSARNVVDFVRLTRPETITISEVKTSAIRSERSAFSRFIGELKLLGYGVEESGVFADDSEVAKEIAVCYEFYESISKRLLVKHRKEMTGGNLEGFRREQRSLARGFFAEKGYEL